ncbi:MAG: HDIG domain-containing protein [Bdellovibrionales bacterium]|jgi:putative nucleotidyltransferase with HDIG domain|nr:HDIG domain-containing protein [Bdellovibrionales bacterium]
MKSGKGPNKLLKGSSKQGSRETLHSRSQYIDHSMRFLDWVNDLGFERTWLGRIVAKLDERLQLRRLAGLFLFALFLSFILFNDFDFSFSARIGETVSRDIKSPVAFEIVDEVSTEQKRRVAEQSVTPVFDYDRSAYDEMYGRIYSAFRKGRDEMRQVKFSTDEFRRWDQVKKLLETKPQFEKLLGQNISDLVYEWLIEKRFSPKIEAALTEQVDRWSQMKIVENLHQAVPVGAREILLREVTRGGRGRESLNSVHEMRDMRDEEGLGTQVVARRHGMVGSDERLYEELAKSLAHATVTPSRQETETRKEKARAEVLPVVISVKKGQVIIPEGSVVQPIHKTLLNEIESQRSHRNRKLVSLVTAMMFVVMALVFFSYLRRFTLNRVVVSTKDLAIMGTVTLIITIITKFFIFLTNSAFSSHFGSMIPETAFVYAAPVAAGTMLVGLLIASGEVVWIFSLFLAVVLGIMVDFKFSFMLVSVVGGLAAARGVYKFKRRNDIYWAGVRTGAVNALMVLLVTVMVFRNDEHFAQILMWSVPAGFLSGILSSLLAAALVPILETVFNVTTDVALMELANLNHPLLKEMIVQAPGTYHHSLVVGSMVEAAAEEIGANPLLAKVMSYYHDIGKTEHAQYFIENQKPGNNPHDHLSPHMSKTILIAHVKDGVELGLEHKLGKPIIDGIVQHHGTTLIQFFYNRAVENQDEEIDEVQEEDFRYPGPKPQFREAALIMLADSIEAASRSLDEPTPMRLQNIVKNIIQRKFVDHQLDDCDLTLRDLSVIEETFIRVLLGIYHQRIDYPKRAGGGAGDTPSASLGTGRSTVGRGHA